MRKSLLLPMNQFMSLIQAKYVAKNKPILQDIRIF